MPQELSPKDLYAKLLPERYGHERRAEKCAALSIPYLFPREGTTGNDDFPTPFQSNLAYGVNTMSSAMTLSMLPVGIPFFRYEMDGQTEAEIRALQQQYEAQGMQERPLDEIQMSLGMWERAIMKEVERKSYRVGVHEALRTTLVVGNIMCEHLTDGGIRNHPLRSYVVKRNPDSTLRYVVLREEKAKDQLTDAEMEALVAVDWAGGLLRDEKVELFTKISFSRGRYEIEQQLGMMMVEDGHSEGEEEDCPFWPLRFTRVSGEDYGRGYVEEYYGDGASLDTTQQALVEAAALSAKVLFMVDPSSGISPKSLSTAANGAFRSGRADGVTTLQVQKAADMRVAFEVWEKLSSQINRAFVVPDIRQAERVTAEEIRFLAQQLERILGGTFPLLMLDLQMPLARQLTKRLGAKRVLPALPRDVIEPVIVTGIQALGRTGDSDKLDRFAATMAAALGPQEASRRLDAGGWAARKATAEGLDPMGLVRTDAQLMAAEQAQQQAMMRQEAMKAAIPAGGKVLAKATPEGSLGAETPAAA